MTKEEFVNRMKLFDLRIYLNCRGGNSDVDPADIWDRLSDPNYTEEMWEAEKEGVTVEEMKEYKRIIEEETHEGYVFKCQALTKKGTRCTSHMMPRDDQCNMMSIQQTIEASKQRHYCSAHKDWHNPLFRQAATVTIEERLKRNKKKHIYI